MKRTLSTLLALGVVSTAALADVAVYSGNANIQFMAGAQPLSRLSVKSVQVIDLETNQLVAISQIKFFGQKQVNASSPVTVQKAVVKDHKNKENTVFTYASSTEAKVTSGLFVGANANLLIKKAADDAAEDVKVALPKTLKGSISDLTIGADVASSSLITSSGVVKFNSKLTLSANATAPAEGKTHLETVVEQIVSDLE